MDEKMSGAFFDSLKRNNQKIRSDRAMSISEDAQMAFKRKVEDLGIEIKKKRRDRENMLDMSPENATSLIVASDFDASEFVKKDLQIGIDIRNLEISYEIAQNRYVHLFGDMPAIEVTSEAAE